MTVGYYTNSSTGPNDLISKIRTAMLAESWIEDDYSSDGTGYRLHMHKTLSDSTVIYVNLRSAIAETGTTIAANNYGGADGTLTGIALNVSTGYDAGEAWHEQPGYPQNSNSDSFAMCMTGLSTSAIPAYYIFFIGDSVHIVCETTSGKFQFLSFGMLVKAGTYTGGLYFTGSFNSKRPNQEYASGYSNYVPHYFAGMNAGDDHGGVYVNADSVTDWRIAQGSATPEIRFPCVAGQIGNPEYSKQGIGSPFWYFAPDSYNSIAIQTPLFTYVKRSDDNYSPLGWPEGIRFLNCQNYTNGQEVPFGSDTWKIFHADSLIGDPTNMYCGFAFLKDDGT